MLRKLVANIGQGELFSEPWVDSISLKQTFGLLFYKVQENSQNDTTEAIYVAR